MMLKVFSRNNLIPNHKLPNKYNLTLFYQPQLKMIKYLNKTMLFSSLYNSKLSCSYRNKNNNYCYNNNNDYKTNKTNYIVNKSLLKPKRSCKSIQQVLQVLQLVIQSRILDCLIVLLPVAKHKQISCNLNKQLLQLALPDQDNQYMYQ